MEKVKLYLKNLLISFVICFVLLFIFSAVLTYTNINDSMLLTFVFISVIVSVLVGSTLNGRKIKEKGIMHGAIFGLSFIAIVYILNLLVFLTPIYNMNMLIYVAITILAGIVGGIFGVNLI